MSNIAQTVCNSIQNNSLFTKRDAVLLAVSGGVDSMVMLDILRRWGYRVAVAHVNYRLRDEESDLDQALVEDVCRLGDITCHTKVVNDTEHHQLTSNNLQSVARELRYAFFDAMMREHGYDYVCTAHHADDQIETLWLQAQRGAGNRGLTSLRMKRGNVRRPLLDVSREEIVSYASAYEISYREDVSNANNKYQRNHLRNVILPALYDKNAASRAAFLRTIRVLADESDFINGAVEQLGQRYLRDLGDELRIGPLSEIRDMSGALTFLHRLTADIGYSEDQLHSILEKKDGGSYEYPIADHESIVFHDELIIRPKQKHGTEDIPIKGEGQYRSSHYQLSIARATQAERVVDADIEYVDGSKVDYPLTLRPVQEGDRFQPIGMNGRSKLVSDYLNELKLSAFEKRDVRLLCQGDEIIWVVGLRLDHRYRITDSTTDFLKISIT